MNKSELIAATAKKSNASKAAVTDVLDACLGVITNEVKKGGKVTLVGWGSFYQTKRVATTGRNPRTGAAIKIPSSKQPKFRAGKSFKDAVNK